MSNKRRILVTGGCGFVGHHLVEHLLKTTDDEIVVLDSLDYASTGYDRLRAIGAVGIERVWLCHTDLSSPIPDLLARELGNIDLIFHLAAQTHVDRSIADPWPFIQSNVVGTYHLLEYARKVQPSALFYFSTDEVFGPADPGVDFGEWDRYRSGNPYAATKAGGEELCLAYANTFKLNVCVTHTMNIFGERQHPEKFIPKVISSCLTGGSIPIHSSMDGVPGSRHWIHARNVSAALMFLADGGVERGEKYNIVGEVERNNLELAQFIAEVLGKELNYELVDYHSSRPGHDLRYSLDGSKLARMGWILPCNFEQSLEKTINWYARELARDI